MDKPTLKTGLLCYGVDSFSAKISKGRKGGAGPLGRAFEVGEVVVNAPMRGKFVRESPFKLVHNDRWAIQHRSNKIPVRFFSRPRFYDRYTSDGVKMSKIALLHAKDCLATTLYQKCIFLRKGEGCKFCAIENSLKQGTTILKKEPEQLAQVVDEAIKENATHMTITMGTPSLKDHGVAMLSDTVKFLKEGFDIPIHVQLTLPGRENMQLLYNSGADTIGVHIETLDKEIFKEMCPGKSRLGFENHLDNLGYAAQIFGENQVSTFILAGLGESKEKTTDGFKKLAEMGVIPYLVPFRPLPNTPLENRSLPSIEYMLELYKKLAETLNEHGVTPLKNKAGCVRCGACSSINEAMEVF